MIISWKLIESIIPWSFGKLKKALFTGNIPHMEKYENIVFESFESFLKGRKYFPMRNFSTMPFQRRKSQIFTQRVKIPLLWNQFISFQRFPYRVKFKSTHFWRKRELNNPFKIRGTSTKIQFFNSFRRSTTTYYWIYILYIYLSIFFIAHSADC